MTISRRGLLASTLLVFASLAAQAAEIRVEVRLAEGSVVTGVVKNLT